MRNYFAVVFLLIPAILFCQNNGIHFQANTWDEAVALARAENKLIFVDGYTTWCAPCKVMDEYVFTHEMTGDLHNSKFINLKVDMEKGMGPLLASRYGVTSYPAYLYLAWDGTLVHKTQGYQNIEKLIDQGNIALQPYRLERALNDRFKGGDRIPDFLYNLISFRKQKEDPSYKDIIPLYLDSEKDWMKSQTMQLVFDHVSTFDSKMFLHMAENKYEYSDVVGAEAFNKKFNHFIKEALDNGGEPISLERRSEIYEVAYPRIADRMMTEYKMGLFLDMGEEEKYAEVAYYYYTEYDPEDMEGIDRDIPLFEKYLKSDEAKAYIRNYHEERARANRTPASLLTLARYSLADFDFDEARLLTKEAKKMAKKAGEDQGPYKDFLKEIKRVKKQNA